MFQTIPKMNVFVEVKATETEDTIELEVEENGKINTLTVVSFF